VRAAAHQHEGGFQHRRESKAAVEQRQRLLHLDAAVITCAQEQPVDRLCWVLAGVEKQAAVRLALHLDRCGARHGRPFRSSARIEAAKLERLWFGASESRVCPVFTQRYPGVILLINQREEFIING